MSQPISRIGRSPFSRSARRSAARARCAARGDEDGQRQHRIDAWLSIGPLGDAPDQARARHRSRPRLEALARVRVRPGAASGSPSGGGVIGDQASTSSIARYGLPGACDRARLRRAAARLRPLARRAADHPRADRARRAGACCEAATRRSPCRPGAMHDLDAKPRRARLLRLPQPRATTPTTRWRSPTRARCELPRVWDLLSRRGHGTVIVLGVPQTYPVARSTACMVSCFLTPDIETRQYTYPPELKDEIEALVGHYMVDVPNFRTDDKEPPPRRHRRDDREAVPRRRAPARDAAVGLLHDGRDGHRPHPPRLLALHGPGAPALRAGQPVRVGACSTTTCASTTKIGAAARRFADEDTAVLVVSDHGAKRMDGGICVNEWLRREGYLVLKEEPDGPVAARRRRWSTGRGRPPGARAATTAGSS